MKAISILPILWFACVLPAAAFDLKEASTERFQVSYVEPERVPDIKELPDYYSGRAQAIKDDAWYAAGGGPEKDRLKMTQLHFRDIAYPIRVTDKVTGIVYEVAGDRRTITATNPKGEVLWKVNPFGDAKLEPYRLKHPVICYFGKTANLANRSGLLLGVGFNSSQFGTLRLSDGKFTFEGQD